MNIDILLDEEDQDRATTTMSPMIFPDEGDIDNDSGLDELPPVLPLLATRNVVVLPGVIIPLMVARAKSRRLVDHIEKTNNKHIIIAPQVDNEEEDPTYDHLIPKGMICEVLRIMQVEEGYITVILQGKSGVDLKGLIQQEPFFTTLYQKHPNERASISENELAALGECIKEVALQLMRLRGDVPPPIIQSFSSMQSPQNLINFAAVNFPLSFDDKIDLYQLTTIKARGYKVLQLLKSLLSFAELKQKIHMRTKKDLDKQQKDYFLQQQMKVIRDELQEGDDSDDVNELLSKGAEKEWSESIDAAFRKEVKKLQRMSQQSPDYAIQMQYLQTMIDLPWGKTTKDNFNISNAAKTLDKDHFGLEKVKDRILEHLAVLKLKGDLRAPIICLYGPPGVGKTSLGQSIAKALNRKYVRVALGGLHDEAEIRGHRRTYIGAMPGRIIKGFLKAQSANPVFVLDEIDKIAADYKGDPSAALLEVLDPEQNSTFHDNYLDLDYDLSKALFIATANSISTIPSALRDRMEMIDVSGYIIEEKIEIALRHLWPRALENHGFTKKMIKIDRATITAIIERYTRESGVRGLEKKLAELCRKAARRVSEALEKTPDAKPKAITIKPNDLSDYLGAALFTQDQYEGNDYAGVVTGLAWTSVGGEILLIESAINPSKSGRMSITGNLGDVMKESAVLALEYIKSHAAKYGIPQDVLDYWNVHIHCPEGAIPKDGPSAGITLVTSLISSFTQRKVRSNIAMTGEITLRGKVLPVGGIKEKILAAKRSGITTIILCKENQKDIDEIKEIYREGLTFIYVSDISEVIEHALSDEKVNNPIDLQAHINAAKALQTEQKA